MRVTGVMLTVLLAGAAASAQENAPCTPGIFLGTLLNAVPHGAGSATVKTTFEQRLLDGDVISGEGVTHVYKNTEGWTRNEYQVNCTRNAEGKLQRELQVTVYKPKTRETLRWTEGPSASKQAVLSRPLERTPQQIAEQQARFKAAAAERAKHPGPDPHVKDEQLGSATIVGLETTGHRTTRTIEPGEEGNTLPLVTVYEYWATKDGRTVVRSIQDDPRRGKTSAEVVELILGEPDAALFAPPAGYTVVENEPQVMVPVPPSTPE